MKRPSLTAQLAEVEHELRMRAEVYGRAVRSRSMRQSEADYRIACMTAVRDTLAWLAQHENTIRQRLAVTQHD